VKAKKPLCSLRLEVTFGHRNMAFTLYHAEMMPLIEISDIMIEELGDNLYKILSKAVIDE